MKIKTVKQLQELVMQEVEGLRKHATLQQKARLNNRLLDVGSPTECIYGLMTGDCHSDEAVELAAKCGVEITFKAIQDNNYERYKLRNVLKTAINAPKESEERGGDSDTFSPMETYIGSRPNDAKNILLYIKGKIDTLNFRGN